MVKTMTTPGGEELVILSRAEYEKLAALVAEAEEDALDAAAYDGAKAALAAGQDSPLPPPVNAQLLRGDSLVAALRKWRGVKQIELAKLSGLSQGYLSDIESGRRKGAARALTAIAVALDVPSHWLV